MKNFIFRITMTNASYFDVGVVGEDEAVAAHDIAEKIHQGTTVFGVKDEIVNLVYAVSATLLPGHSYVGKAEVCG